MGSALCHPALDLADLARVEDFVAWMAAQPVRYEMIDGRLTMMPGGTRLQDKRGRRVGRSERDGSALVELPRLDLRLPLGEIYAGLGWDSRSTVADEDRPSTG